VLYFTYWFPNRFRSIAVLFLAGPIANALSNIMSGAILEMNGVLGRRGWQWVFLIEAAPAVILSLVGLRRMIDRPSLANWLKPDERQWLEKEFDDERASTQARGPLTLGKALMRLWDDLLPAANGQGSRLVQCHDGRRIGDTLRGRYDCALVERSNRGPSLALDRRFPHRRCRICGRGRGRKLLPVAAGGVSRSRRNLWDATNVLATSLDFLFSGTAAAGGIALINSIGNLRGNVGSFVVGWIKDSTNSLQIARYFLAGCSHLFSLPGGPAMLGLADYRGLQRRARFLH
jgi:MFS transporter, ACS family, tartrate transporter